MNCGVVLLAQTGVARTEADKLFHADPRWLGSDAAFSIDLGHGRVLWMFNDTFYRPPESDAPDAFVCAGKSHPELTGADLILTYATNSLNGGKLAADMNLYFHRFVRVALVPRTPMKQRLVHRLLAVDNLLDN